MSSRIYWGSIQQLCPSCRNSASSKEKGSSGIFSSKPHRKTNIPAHKSLKNLFKSKPRYLKILWGWMLFLNLQTWVYGQCTFYSLKLLSWRGNSPTLVGHGSREEPSAGGRNYIIVKEDLLVVWLLFFPRGLVHGKSRIVRARIASSFRPNIQSEQAVLSRSTLKISFRISYEFLKWNGSHN